MAPGGHPPSRVGEGSPKEGDNQEEEGTNIFVTENKEEGNSGKEVRCRSGRRRRNLDLVAS